MKDGTAQADLGGWVTPVGLECIREDDWTELARSVRLTAPLHEAKRAASWLQSLSVTYQPPASREKLDAYFALGLRRAKGSANWNEQPAETKRAAVFLLRIVRLIEVGVALLDAEEARPRGRGKPRAAARELWLPIACSAFDDWWEGPRRGAAYHDSRRQFIWCLADRIPFELPELCRKLNDLLPSELKAKRARSTPKRT